VSTPESAPESASESAPDCSVSEPSSAPIQVVGLGLDGAAGLPLPLQTLVQQAAVLVGSPRHLAAFPSARAERWPLLPLDATLQRLQGHLQQPGPPPVVVLASGDPLFFGLGRLLLSALPPAALRFHPQPSAVQLAFSRIQRPWQGATLLSVHGRPSDELVGALRRGDPLIAVLSDPVHHPAALAELALALDLPQAYRLWVCEQLGSPQERIVETTPAAAARQPFSPLSVVIFERCAPAPPVGPWPLVGIPDHAFASFEDRPGLMTKREVRLQILGELALAPGQVVWDVGAGTGSVAVEVARLLPGGQVFAVEKTAAGLALIRQNCQRFGLGNVVAVAGEAPAAVAGLPPPARVFVGGSGGQLAPTLSAIAAVLVPGGKIVVAMATLESVATVRQWIDHQPQPWQHRWLQVNLARSAPVGPLTRWLPLNPVTLVTLSPTTADGGARGEGEEG